MSLIFLLIFLLYLFFWLSMLVHCLQNRQLRDGEKIVWVVVLLFLHVLGPILYFFIVRNR
jgi:hypothetical protein